MTGLKNIEYLCHNILQGVEWLPIMIVPSCSKNKTQLEIGFGKIQQAIIVPYNGVVHNYIVMYIRSQDYKINLIINPTTGTYWRTE